MDTSNPTFQEFRVYWQLSEEMIAEAARILAMQAAHYARKYGEVQLPDRVHLLPDDLQIYCGAFGSQAHEIAAAAVASTAAIKERIY